MTLFEHRMARDLDRLAPLAERMRPRNLAGFVGQEHILGPDTVLKRSLDAGHIPSMVLWGPPGTGKTTLAQIIANSANAHFERVSAVTSGVADLRRVVSEAGDRLGMHGGRTILFVDEIHRFNKAQQDVILPHVERGTVILIGATTENPSFEVISPLLSRARVYTLRQLTNGQISEILDSAMSDSERGLANLNPTIEDDAREALVALSNGDARIALNTLELAVNGTPPEATGVRLVSLKTVEDAIQRRATLYDKSGDQHYDTISAFIKSVRSSDPDAAVYWLARMLHSGEDLMFIARRLVILAAEDVGLADPNALTVAVSAQQAVHLVGMPEGRIPLSQATVYLASAPKSNRAYMAINEALRDAERTMNEPVPLHLRNAVTDLMRDQEYGKGYKYTHDYEGGFTPTQNLPENLRGKRYYQPSEQGYEAEVSDRLKRWWGKREG
ncbi:MAG: replication-associated recombination protein A [Dehalococcoidia bacterium]|nr:replication-associated recombination protein A [Dehalococcoidia bacterium]